MKRALSAFFVALVIVACRPSSPAGPEAMCAEKCEARLTKCNAHQCARGCNFIMDRLVEHEGDRVLACVAKAGACDDQAFATCAVRVGPNADGGPPAPKPPGDDDDE